MTETVSVPLSMPPMVKVQGSLQGVPILGGQVAGSSNTQYGQADFQTQQTHVDITTLNDVHTKITNALEALVPNWKKPLQILAREGRGLRGRFHTSIASILYDG